MSTRPESSHPPRPFVSGLRSPIIAPVTRALLGIPLFLLTTKTAKDFAWTIKPPLTAAVLGANYFTSAAGALLAARQRFWSQGRVVILMAIAFAPITTAATFIHLNLFHTDSSGFTLVITYFWLIAYGIYPVQLAVGLVKQLRTPGSDPPPTRELPTWARGILGVHAAVLLPVGVLLFVASGSLRSLWPWHLTPLTSRAVSAWVLAFGVGAAYSLYENDFDRVKLALWSYLALALLQTVALLRFGDVVQWGKPGAWVYVGYLASALILGAYGCLTARAIPREARGLDAARTQTAVRRP